MYEVYFTTDFVRNLLEKHWDFLYFFYIFKVFEQYFMSNWLLEQMFKVSVLFLSMTLCAGDSNIRCMFLDPFFYIEQLQYLVETFLACFFFPFLIFDPKWRFRKGYSLCLVAIFAKFQNALIFQILAAFSSRFLHGVTELSCRNAFSIVFFIFQF